jgi:hypothetical protein
MENKKLVKILLKDMGELEELIAEIKANKKFDSLEMEFIHSRAKGILQLLQLFNSKNETVSETLPVESEKSAENAEKTEMKEFVEEPVQDEKADETDDVKNAEQEEIHYEKPEAPTVKSNIPGVAVHEETENKKPDDDSEIKSDDDMLEEEIEKVESVSRLGDSFLKGKPVNDRFMNIRELFDGNNQKFLETFKTLDSKQNIKEAVDYLRNNFRWKRNETSLKFVNLVKRRFINE